MRYRNDREHIKKRPSQSFLPSHVLFLHTTRKRPAEAMQGQVPNCPGMRRDLARSPWRRETENREAKKNRKCGDRGKPVITSFFLSCSRSEQGPHALLHCAIRPCSPKGKQAKSQSTEAVKRFISLTTPGTGTETMPKRTPHHLFHPTSFARGR